MKGYHPELIILESPSLDVLLESLSVLLKSLHSIEVNTDQHEIPTPQRWVGANLSCNGCPRSRELLLTAGNGSIQLLDFLFKSCYFSLPAFPLLVYMVYVFNGCVCVCVCVYIQAIEHTRMCGILLSDLLTFLQDGGLADLATRISR